MFRKLKSDVVYLKIFTTFVLSRPIRLLLVRVTMCCGIWIAGGLFWQRIFCILNVRQTSLHSFTLTKIIAGNFVYYNEGRENEKTRKTFCWNNPHPNDLGRDVLELKYLKNLLFSSIFIFSDHDYASFPWPPCFDGWVSKKTR